MKLLRNQKKQLVSVTRNFITDKSKNSITPNKIEVSKYLIVLLPIKTKGDVIDFFKLV
jgi:hypothetical protein